MSVGFLYAGASAYAVEVEARAESAYARFCVARDEPYGPHPRQRVDVFAPAARGSRRLPLVAFIHGGGWVKGDKKWAAFMAETVTALPAVFVSIGYRLAPDDRWPAPGHDCLAAVEWIFRHAAKWHADPQSIVLGGHSAGAHLAAWVATHLPAGARLKLCAPVSGSFDLRFRDAQPGTMEERVQKFLFSRPEDEIDASPALAIRAGLPPFHITWGEHDLPRICSQGAAFAAGLRDLGVPCDTLELPGTDHFAAHLHCGEPGGAWIRGLRAALHGVQTQKEAT